MAKLKIINKNKPKNKGHDENEINDKESLKNSPKIYYKHLPLSPPPKRNTIYIIWMGLDIYK